MPGITPLRGPLCRKWWGEGQPLCCGGTAKRAGGPAGFQEAPDPPFLSRPTCCPHSSSCPQHRPHALTPSRDPARHAVPLHPPPVWTVRLTLSGQWRQGRWGRGRHPGLQVSAVEAGVASAGWREQGRGHVVGEGLVLARHTATGALVVALDPSPGLQPHGGGSTSQDLAPLSAQPRSRHFPLPHLPPSPPPTPQSTVSGDPEPGASRKTGQRAEDFSTASQQVVSKDRIRGGGVLIPTALNTEEPHAADRTGGSGRQSHSSRPKCAHQRKLQVGSQEGRAPSRQGPVGRGRWGSRSKSLSLSSPRLWQRAVRRHHCPGRPDTTKWIQ